MTRGFEFIRLQVSARAAWLEFNRAPVNAFNREMVLEVREAIAAALTDPEVRSWCWQALSPVISVPAPICTNSRG